MVQSRRSTPPLLLRCRLFADKCGAQHSATSGLALLPSLRAG